MWDVKELKIQEAIQGSGEFYLNYVGCKDEEYEKILNELKGFTLTMWDVKDALAKVLIELGYRFYLNYVGCKGF